MKVANISPKDVAEFRYLGLTVLNQNYIYKETKNVLKFENACHLSFHILLSSFFPRENVKIKMYETILLCVVLYEHRSWCLT